jgi:hypothetical protein
MEDRVLAGGDGILPEVGRWYRFHVLKNEIRAE